MDKYKDVPQIAASEFATGNSVYTSMTAETGIYTEEMSWMRSKINLEAPTADANKIN